MIGVVALLSVVASQDAFAQNQAPQGDASGSHGRRKPQASLPIASFPSAKRTQLRPRKNRAIRSLERTTPVVWAINCASSSSGLPEHA